MTTAWDKSVTPHSSLFLPNEEVTLVARVLELRHRIERCGIHSRRSAAASVEKAAVMRGIALASCVLIVTGDATSPEPLPTPNHITSRIARQSFQSTAIAKVGYSKARHILEIEFVNGAVYRYLDVQVTVCRDLMSAESKARFYDANIRKHYRFALVRPPQAQKSRKQSPGSAQSYSATMHN